MCVIYEMVLLEDSFTGNPKLNLVKFCLKQIDYHGRIVPPIAPRKNLVMTIIVVVKMTGVERYVNVT